MSVDARGARPDLRNPLHLLAFGFGSGLAPRAPGTWGTVAALLPWYFLQQLPLPGYIAAIVIAAAAGIAICGRTARDLGVHDHGGIVWDEFVGLWIALLWVPLQPLWVLAGFLLFRLFDIFKPWPISWCDRHLQGGFGIMVDDLLAGAAACVVLQLLILGAGSV